jgi:hypothetical protein
VEKIVGKIFLDHITLITTTNDKIVDTKRAIDLENVPENGPTTHLHQGLGAHHRFFSETGAASAGEDDSLQGVGSVAGRVSQAR